MKVEDRLGALQDDLLLAIIERLGLKEAAKTAILSKRWRFVWTNLAFPFSDTSKNIDGKRRFVAMVHASLALRTFSVAFNHESRFDGDVDSWLAGIYNKAERVTLHLQRRNYLQLQEQERRYTPQRRYTLPHFTYSTSSLTHLDLENCNVPQPEKPVQWRLLKSLLLTHVDLRQQAIGEILSGCPLLEDLSLYCCSGFSRLEIGGRSFRSLTVRHPAAPAPRLEISAPYMITLLLTVCFNSFGRTLRFGNLRSLSSAYFELSVQNWASVSTAELRTTVEKFLGLCLRCVNLVLFSCFTKSLSVLVADGWRLGLGQVLCRVESLHLIAAADMRSIGGVVGILESCPCVRSLNVCSLGPKQKQEDQGSIHWGPITRDDLNCDLMHLRSVCFSKFFDSSYSVEPTFTLARILLKRAPFLERMEIDITGLLAPEGYDYMEKILPHCPRSSQNVSIEFRHK